MSDSRSAVVRRTVAERTPIDAVEGSMIESFLGYFDELSAPFDQSAGPIHVTGSAIVMGSRGVVLLKHRRLGLWLQPGGHLDPGELPWEAALREAQEETGLDGRFIDVDDEDVPFLVHVDVHPGGRGHTHLDLRYVVEAGPDDPDPPAGESQEIAWFSWPDAIERASDERLSSLLAHLGSRDA